MTSIDAETRRGGDAERGRPASPRPRVSASAPAITVRHVSKRYRLYTRQSDRLAEWLIRRPRHRPFWALRDVSFEVARGEIVGIIGRNGAGKTTLLRLLTGISPPTSGEIEVNERMSAILELGSGFHPEFSGRENVFIGGAVLGMSEEEITRKFDGIVAFSELGPYMEMPYKTYSLGMQARLAFSVAISVEPDILIVDEALAAGDSAFIAKCFERIRQICASGATVLFVSHNTYLVQRLCRRALWIESGRLAGDGDPALVCRDYEAALRAHEEAQREARHREELSRFSDAAPAGGATGVAAARNGLVAGPSGADGAAGAAGASGQSSAIWGTGELRITNVELVDAHHRPARTFFSGEPMTIRLSYEGQALYDDLAAVVLVTRADGIPACTLDCREAGLNLPPLHGSGCCEITLDPLLLGRGRYYLSPHVYRDRHGIVAPDDVLVYHDRLYEFDVERRGRPYDVALEQPATWRLTDRAEVTPARTVTSQTE